ncbi:hypothetical protein FA15DRAFT_665376, partial [Coprinopsis marcescibilis]
MLAFVLASQILVAAAASLPQSLQARAVVDTPPSGFAITSTTVSGAGCPPGSFATFPNANLGVQVVYSSLYAQIGPDAPVSERTNACQVAITASVPVGYAFGVARIQSRGYKALDAGSTATRSVSYQFNPSTSASASGTHTGPPTGADFSADDVFGAGVVFSDCAARTATVTITESLSLAGSASPLPIGYIAVDSVSPTPALSGRLAP